MNTQRSIEALKLWKERESPLKKGSFTIERTFRTSPEELFSLICPTREYDWIPGWSCDLLHSTSGYAEYGAVFRTAFRGMEEIWVCTRYEPNRAIDYSISYQGMASKFEFSVIEDQDGTVTGRWVISVSPLTEAQIQGEEELELGKRRFEMLIDVLDHYVHTGEMRA